MKKEAKEPKVVLSKTSGWIILIALIILDASLDLIFAHGRGLESGIWRRVTNPLFLTPLVLVLFYLLAKGGAWLAKNIDKVTIKAEELVLTTLVIVYGLFDLWLISVYIFNFRLFKTHYYLIPILIIAGIIYETWAEKKLKPQKKLQN